LIEGNNKCFYKREVLSKMLALLTRSIFIFPREYISGLARVNSKKGKLGV